MIAKEDKVKLLVETFEPFLNIRDQCPESAKLVVGALGGLTPVTVTVTKAQFLRAHAALVTLRARANKEPA